MIKRFALLRLEYGSNKVVFDFTGTFEQARQAFNKTLVGSPLLDEQGYCKVNETVSLCMAEYHENFTTLA